MYGAWPQLEKCGGCGDSEFLLHALANGPLARGPLLDSAAKLGCKPENLHRPRAGFGMAAKPEPLEVD